MSKVMNHIEYPKSLRGKSDVQLQFIVKDATEAINAMPDGDNVGYYQDEILYCCAELRRRKSVGGSTTVKHKVYERFEVITEAGRTIARPNVVVNVMEQDGGKTLKVFIKGIEEGA